MSFPGTRSDLLTSREPYEKTRKERMPEMALDSQGNHNQSQMKTIFQRAESYIERIGQESETERLSRARSVMR